MIRVSGAASDMDGVREEMSSTSGHDLQPSSRGGVAGGRSSHQPVRSAGDGLAWRGRALLSHWVALDTDYGGWGWDLPCGSIKSFSNALR